MLGCGHISGYNGDAIPGRGAGNLAKRLAAPCDEFRFLQQIGRRITANGQLGKQDEVSATLLRPAREIDDFCGVPAEIPHGGIDLGQRNLHSFSVATGMDRSGVRIPDAKGGQTAVRVAVESKSICAADLSGAGFALSGRRAVEP